MTMMTSLLQGVHCCTDSGSRPHALHSHACQPEPHSEPLSQAIPKEEYYIPIIYYILNSRSWPSATRWCSCLLPCSSSLPSGTSQYLMSWRLIPRILQTSVIPGMLGSSPSASSMLSSVIFLRANMPLLAYHVQSYMSRLVIADQDSTTSQPAWTQTS